MQKTMKKKDYSKNKSNSGGKHNRQEIQEPRREEKHRTAGVFEQGRHLGFTQETLGLAETCIPEKMLIDWKKTRTAVENEMG